MLVREKIADRRLPVLQRRVDMPDLVVVRSLAQMIAVEATRPVAMGQSRPTSYAILVMPSQSGRAGPVSAALASAGTAAIAPFVAAGAAGIPEWALATMAR